MSSDFWGGVVACVVLVTLFVVAILDIVVTGQEERAGGAVCAVRVEHTKTGADTLALIREHPECARYVAGKGEK